MCADGDATEVYLLRNKIIEARNALKDLEEREAVGENNAKRTNDRITEDDPAAASDADSDSHSAKRPRKKKKTVSKGKGKRKQEREDDESDCEEDGDASESEDEKHSIPYEGWDDEKQIKFEGT